MTDRTYNQQTNRKKNKTDTEGEERKVKQLIKLKENEFDFVNTYKYLVHACLSRRILKRTGKMECGLV